MEIISLSVNIRLLEEIDSLVKDDGYSSRSEVFRAGIRELLENKRDKLSGQSKCLVVVAHKKSCEEKITKVKHIYENLIETQIHTHLADERCTEIFVLSGEGKEINELMINMRKAGAEKIILIPS
jgi:CopG family transcriptional regulator, nickel-responsive regulator